MTNSKSKSILVVDDDQALGQILTEVLIENNLAKKNENEVIYFSSSEEALEWMKTHTAHIIVSDIRMKGMDGLSFLKKIRSLSPKSVTILMTAFGNMDGAVQAIQDGAFDYISKPFQMPALLELVSRALKQVEYISALSDQPKVQKLKEPPRAFIGTSQKMLEVYKTIARAAMSSSTALIQGESGTGKELVAHAIHDKGPRAQKPFIAINCGAIPEQLLESELFGHVKGAFTGALNDRKGLFQEANEGTLFLDEIGDVSPAIQVKLLRVLQEGEFKKVGGNETLKSDVRIIAATHRKLDALVAAEKFREDLFYRLKVIQVEIPPLRERREDIPRLIEHFLELYANRNQKNVSHLSDEALELLKNYSWPGNVRELEHAVERAVALSNSSVLSVEDFEKELGKIEEPNTAAKHSEESSLESLEKAHILKVLSDVNYNKSKAAEILGIDRATLYRKAARYGIDFKQKI